MANQRVLTNNRLLWFLISHLELPGHYSYKSYNQSALTCWSNCSEAETYCWVHEKSAHCSEQSSSTFEIRRYYSEHNFSTTFRTSRNHPLFSLFSLIISDICTAEDGTACTFRDKQQTHVTMKLLRQFVVVSVLNLAQGFVDVSPVSSKHKFIVRLSNFLHLH